MNILPKEGIQFAQANYWDKFFKSRGPQKLEWYGEYLQLSSELDKYIKFKDFILVIGCGNSELSTDLYDLGYKNIVNIDISGVVIRQMKIKMGNDRPGMVFEEMDALNMTFESDKFSVVLDKGTLDALMPTDSDEDHIRAQKLFLEINKVLKIGGRYIIISLLQSHILKRILEHFTTIGWMIRVIRCLEVEKNNILENGQSGMPVFMVVCTKLRKMSNVANILEANIYVNDKIQRIQSKEELIDKIDKMQKALMKLKDTKGEVVIEFYRLGSSSVRYLIYIVDINSDQRLLRKYGAFIVPVGRETEWIFGNEEGRKFLLKESGYDRLAVVTLRRDMEYKGKDEIQNELNTTILQFAPCYMENSEIPYLTIGDDLGRRETIFRCFSEFSGEIIVEEVEINGDRYRRLIFMDNQAVVQSEVKLLKGVIKEYDPVKKNWKIDNDCPLDSHINYMAIAVGLVKKPKSVLVIGLGGGGLCLLLNRLYPSLNVTGIEIDPVIVKVAKEYFGLREGKFLKVVISDGVEFMKKSEKYDVIMLDVDSKEKASPVTSPPPQFLESSVLECFKNCIGDTGVLVINLVSRIGKMRGEIIAELRNYFFKMALCDLKDDVNKILFLSNKDLTDAEWKSYVKNASDSLNRKAKEKLKSGSLLDLNHLMSNLTV